VPTYALAFGGDSPLAAKRKASRFPTKFLAENHKSFLDRNFISLSNAEFPFAKYDERQQVMLKKALLAAAAITAASMSYAHAETVRTRHLVCQPIAVDRKDRDPIIRTDVLIQTTWRPNGTVASMIWNVAHHSQHGATFNREDQYNNVRWIAYPARAVFQWTGHLDGNYPVFMTGELDDSSNHAWSHYNEYIQNWDHPWERTQVVSRNVCHDEDFEQVPGEDGCPVDDCTSTQPYTESAPTMQNAPRWLRQR
jgi:hypothetical protein